MALSLTLCSCLFTYAAQDKTSDSLQKELILMPHDTTRLATIRSIIKAEQTNPKCIQYADTLLKEAFRQKNDRYICLAAYYHTVYYHNQMEQDSVAKWIFFMEPYVKKAGLWDYFFDAKRYHINLSIFKGRYELAIDEANKLKQQAIAFKSNKGLIAAYQCLANAYASTQQWEESTKAMEMTYKLLENETNSISKISVLTQMAIISKAMEKDENVFKYVHELDAVLSKHIKENPYVKKGFYDVYLFKELFYAYYYLKNDNLSKANDHLTASKDYLTPNTFHSYRFLYYELNSKYYEQRGDYAQALAYIDSTLFKKDEERAADYADHLIDKARLLVIIGKSEQAIPLYKEALSLKDKVTTDTFNKQMLQIKKDYNLERLDLEQIKLDKKAHLFILIGIALTLFISILFMWRSIRMRKALKQSELAIRKAAETVHEANEMKNRFLSNMSYNIRTPLNNVVGFSQLLASDQEFDDETLKDYSTIIHDSSEELMKLVNDVLDLSRLEAGMMKFQIQDYDIVTLCKEAVCISEMQNEGSNIKIVFLSHIESQMIKTDVARLSNVLVSLLTSSDHEEKRTIYLLLNHDNDPSTVNIVIKNSPLAHIMPTQKRGIKHDINKLLLEFFGGKYEITKSDLGELKICLTYPTPNNTE